MICNPVDLQRVRRQFSGSAGSYDSHAEVQKVVVDRLSTMIAGQGRLSGPVLEIGTGTGLLGARLKAFWPNVSLILSDLAHDIPDRLVNASKAAMGWMRIAGPCRSYRAVSPWFAAPRFFNGWKISGRLSPKVHGFSKQAAGSLLPCSVQGLWPNCRIPTVLPPEKRAGRSAIFMPFPTRTWFRTPWQRADSW
jgi:hypothetical protein